MQAIEQQQEKVCVSVWLMRTDKITADGGLAGESEFYCMVLIKARGSGVPGAGGEPPEHWDLATRQDFRSMKKFQNRRH